MQKWGCSVNLVRCIFVGVAINYDGLSMIDQLMFVYMTVVTLSSESVSNAGSI